MNVRARGRTRYRGAKSEERDPIALKIGDQRFSLGTIRVQGDIHRIAVIESHAIVRG